jgi:archaellum component FlaC
MNYALIILQKVRAIVDALGRYAEAVDSLETNIKMIKQGHIYEGTSGDIFSRCENDLESMEVTYKQAQKLANTLREEIDEQCRRVKKIKEKVEKDSRSQA